jgi:NAD(P)-dependent dehydrogenase (short-subunit alcohol dehydrogenase family)
MNDEHRVAVVSGANRGIGREVARQLADKGIAVILTARDPDKAEEAARELAKGDGRMHGWQLDVSDQESVDRLAASVEQDFGRLDILVNNAGIGGDTRSRGSDADLDEVKATLDTNLFGAWRLATALIPLMERTGNGRIVNLSSGMGQLSEMGGGAPSYRLSKAGLNVLTRILSNELAGSGIKVNSVCPGWVRTDMGGAGARKDVEDGADTPVWLATLPDDGPSGGFFRDRKPIDW